MTLRTDRPEALAGHAGSLFAGSGVQPGDGGRASPGKHLATGRAGVAARQKAIARRPDDRCRDAAEAGALGDVRRDHFIALSPRAEWLWVFRSAGGWFMHGVFA
ncbi:MAG: hypothetical protein HY777_07710 [Betaproteobacteria bacterium]|nr:hypothetical protein [Betaproteobacteria bacterium]